MNIPLPKALISFLLYCLFFPVSSLYARGIDAQNPTMGMYAKDPFLLSSSVKPAVMVLFDDSRSMSWLAYKPQKNPFNAKKDYYGLFNSHAYYCYNSSGYFEQCSKTESDSWSGNWLNWATMRRVDIAKKVLTGGRKIKEGETYFVVPEHNYFMDYGEDKSNSHPAGGGKILHTNDGSHLTPYDNLPEIRILFDRYSPSPQKMRIYTVYKVTKNKKKEIGTFSLKIKLPAGEVPQGFFQENADLARYGLTTFEPERNDGGFVRSPIGTSVDTLITTINNTPPVHWTPLGESLETVKGYFKQDRKILEKYSSSAYKISTEDDPFLHNGEKLNCIENSFVIMVTDGVPERDKKANLADVALDIHTKDLKPGNSFPGTQILTLFPIYIFDPDRLFPPDIFIKTAENGGFDDKNNNGKIDHGEVTQKLETASNGQQKYIPSNLFNAQDGPQLVKALGEVADQIKTISQSSGTSVSVLNSSIDGSGATFQSIFYPSLTDKEGHQVLWAGDINALLIDSYGNFREDTNHNQKLDLMDDLIIVTKANQETGAISVSKYKDANGNGFLEKQFTLTEKTTNLQKTIIVPFGEKTPEFDLERYTVEESYSEMMEQSSNDSSLQDIAYLWSGGNWLSHIANDDIAAQRSSYLSSEKKRYIFTYIDKNRDNQVDSGEIFDFTTDSLAMGDDYTGYLLGTANVADKPFFNDDNKVDNEDLKILINYIRGKDDENNPKIRSRKYNSQNILGNPDNVDSDAVWRLGDIISSSPTTLQAPFTGYDTTYNSKSYRKFKRKYADRRTMVYTGSNDGIFHGFNGGFYQKEYITAAGKVENKFWRKCEKDSDTGKITCNDPQNAPEIGQEMWAYVPQNLLPHLQWLPHNDYRHVFYNDMPPFIFEAQLWDKENDPVHVGGWGTLLIGGMRFGGGSIEVNTKVWKDDNSSDKEKRIMRSAYFVLDITDPEKKPVLLDEFTIDTDDRASFTTVVPSLEYVTTNAEKEERDWFLLLGTGPTTLQGESTQKAKVFVRKLESLAGMGQGGTRRGKFGNWVKNFQIDEENSFIGGFHGSDFQITDSPGAFTTDAVYFGTVAGINNNKTGSTDKKWGGKIHRIVVDNGTNDPAAISSWKDKVLFNANAPISTRPQVSLDNEENVWVYFGTGRYLNTGNDKEYLNQKMQLYGIKEEMTTAGDKGKIPLYSKEVNISELFETSMAKIFAGTNAANSAVEGITSVEYFSDLVDEIDKKQGWHYELPTSGERVVVDPTIRSQMVNFNTFVPSEDVCSSSSKGNTYNFYYKTGTAFWRPIMGIDKDEEKEVLINGTKKQQFLSIPSKPISGLGSSSSFHRGEGGLKQIIQDDKGEIQQFPVVTPGPHTSSRIFWQEIWD